MVQRTRPGVMANAWAETVWREEIENADEEEDGLPPCSCCRRRIAAVGTPIIAISFLKNWRSKQKGGRQSCCCDTRSATAMAGQVIVLVSAHMMLNERKDDAKKRKRRGPYDPYPGWAAPTPEAEFWRMIGDGPVAFTRPGGFPTPSAPAAEPAKQTPPPAGPRPASKRRTGR